MKKKWRLVYLGIAICLIASMLIIGCAKPAPAPTPAPTPAPKPTPAPAPAPRAEPITLKALTFISPKAGTNVVFIKFIERVNEASKGELVIDLLGGPEVIGSFDQTEALKTGVIDMCHLAASRYEPILPEAAAFALSEINIAEQRKTGFTDLMVELHKEINYFYLGSVRHDIGFFLWTNFRPETPYDLAGHRMRTGALYDLFMKEVGISATTMEQAEVYTAIERGLVEGYGDTMSSTIRYKFYEVTKYCINHPFYYSNVTTVLNLDTWNSLPKHLQDLMQGIMLEMEPEAVAFFDEVNKEEEQQILEAGMEFIEFSPADAKWYVDTAYRVVWENFEKLSPEYASRLKELSSR